jgi:hypothetical protein
MRKTLTAFLIATLCLVCSAVIGCALTLPMSQETLIKTSRDIVYGQVTDIQCEKATNSDLIYTFAKIRIIEQFKGQPLGKEVTVQALGGGIDGKGVEVSDEPIFTKKSLVVVHTYLPPDSLRSAFYILKSGCYWVQGGERGLLLVEKDRIPRYEMTLAEYRELVRQLTK